MSHETLDEILSRYWLTAEERDYFYDCAEHGCSLESLKEFLIRCWPEPDEDDFGPDELTGTDGDADDF